MKSPSDLDIAHQFQNEGRTRISTPQSYPLFLRAIEDMSKELDQYSDFRESFLMKGDLLSYWDKFVSWRPGEEPASEERSQVINDFLICYTKYRSQIESWQKGTITLSSQVTPSKRSSHGLKNL